MIIDLALTTVGGSLLLGLLAAVWTSWREGEPRAAVILSAALLLPALYLGVALADFDGRSTLAAVMVGLPVALGLAVLVPGRAPRLAGDDTPRGRIDERVIMFSRALLRPGSEPFREYYESHPEHRALDEAWRAKPGLLQRGSSAYHRLAFSAADASFTTIEHLRPFVDGDCAPDRAELHAEEATRFLRRWARKLGAASVGFTELEDYHLYSHVGRGADRGEPVTLDHRYAVALTVEMDKTALEHAPLAPTVMESAQQYVDSGVIAAQMAQFIRNLGWPARAHVDGNYRVVCPLVARDAGLGEIGRMGLLMTPRLGPRVRIAVVTTDLPLVPSPRRRDPTVIDFCVRCLKCAEVCPGDAIPLEGRVDIDGARRWRIDSEACFGLWNALGTDCARCMAVCPYSHPDNWMHNLVRRGVRLSGRFRRLAVLGDDVLYGRRSAPRPLPDWLGPG
jgi:ferredoxin